MSNKNEATRVKDNQQVIREYLLDQFKGFEITEDRPIHLDCHKFTVTKLKPLEQYSLKGTSKNSQRFLMERVKTG